MVLLNTGSTVIEILKNTQTVLKTKPHRIEIEQKFYLWQCCLCFYTFKFSSYQNCCYGSLKPQYHFSWQLFFCLRCALKLFHFGIVETIIYVAHPQTSYYPSRWNNNISHIKSSYLSQLIAPHQTPLEPHCFLGKIWRWKPGYQPL